MGFDHVCSGFLHNLTLISRGPPHAMARSQTSRPCSLQGFCLFLFSLKFLHCLFFNIYIYLGLSLCYIILYMLELLKEKVSIIKGADHIHMCMYICHVHTPLPDQCKWQKMTIKDLFKFCRKHCKITQYIMKQQVGFGAGTCTEYGVHFWYLEFLSQNVVSKSHMWHS